MTRAWRDGTCEIVVMRRTFRIQRMRTDGGDDWFEASRNGTGIGTMQRRFMTLVQQIGTIVERQEYEDDSLPEIDRRAAAVSWEWVDPDDLTSAGGHRQAIRVTWLESRRPHGAMQALRTLRDWAARTRTGLAIDVTEPRTPTKAGLALARMGFERTAPDTYEPIEGRDDG